MEDLEAGFGRLSAVAEQLRMPYSNRVVISADEDWLSLWLKPRLARFLARYPELDVVTTVGLEADLTVTFRAAEDCDLLFRDYLLPVVSPENQRRIADIPLESRLEGFPLLHADYYARDALAFNWPRWVQRFGHRSANSDRGVRYARIGHAVEGVTSNAGILLCGLGLVLTAVESGELVLPFPLEEGAWTEYGYCLEPADSEPLRRPARLLREWLREEATVTRAALSARLRNRATSGAEVGPA
ncbi:LysR substrate-binding domain-containing protein [Microbulbifer litoralis]|uniref:LysR substrate-binding domain-containing protein n=1 Tax=Microbulbifer litoralis TaxID=2933965 RepID=UPI002028BCF9|nr:LysR substrate-binding domain-containing protein [Microbulbifer sp. GX H0434]